MRLVDADAIIPKGTRITPDNVDLAKAIRFAPTVDVVPVVRCRECKLHTSSAFYHDMLFCVEHGTYVDPNGYCYLGERKEGADL